MLVCALLVTAFYLAPVEPDAAGPQRALRGVLAITAIVLVAVVITRMAARVARDQPGTTATSLIVALVSGVMVFAFVDYLVAVTAPDQFAGLETKTDALYFAVTTLATVGYGDIHATGQLGRVVVIVQQLFNLVVLATGVTVLGRWWAARLRPRT